MTRKESIYCERLQFGITKTMRRRFLRLAQRLERKPGELYRDVLARGIENHERTLRAQESRRSAEETE